MNRDKIVAFADSLTQEEVSMCSEIMERVQARKKAVKKCLVSGCPNTSDQGTFVGDLCYPCNTAISGITSSEGESKRFIDRIPWLKEYVIDESPEWITMEDRLPDSLQWCWLAWKNSKDIGMGTYHSSDKMFALKDSGYYCGVFEFTHWLPVVVPVYPNL